MNKEELLQRLENIQKKVESSRLSEYALGDKVEILEGIFKVKYKKLITVPIEGKRGKG
jgi:hypothetical protein